MNFLEYFYQDTLANLLLTKFNVQTQKDLIIFQKIEITLNIKKSDNLLFSSFLLFLVTSKVCSFKRIKIKLFKSKKVYKVAQLKVTLQKKEMYNFLFFLIFEALPNLLKHEPVSYYFSGEGNFVLKLENFFIFPQARNVIDYLKKANLLEKRINYEITFFSKYISKQHRMSRRSLMQFLFIYHAK
jgi:ribosomal protein L5